MMFVCCGRWRSGFRTVAPSPKDFTKPRWRSWSWQREQQCYKQQQQQQPAHHTCRPAPSLPVALRSVLGHCLLLVSHYPVVISSVHSQQPHHYPLIITVRLTCRQCRPNIHHFLDFSRRLTCYLSFPIDSCNISASSCHCIKRSPASSSTAWIAFQLL